VPALSYRQAALGDAGEIFELLLALAAEIPLLLDTLAREEALYAEIRNCARSGESWVACAADGRIVAAVLAETDQHGRHYAEHEIIRLRYAGQAASCPDPAILDALIECLLARMVPVTAHVGPQNRSGLAARLERLGFRQDASPGGEQLLRRDPG
jgi:hypothetical protein